MTHPLYPVIILLLPLAAFVVQVFFGRRLPRGGDWVSTGAIVAGFALSLPLLAEVFTHYDPHFRHEDSITWMTFGSVTITMGILTDNLSVVMLVLVTGISSCVHVFSIYYMHGDKGYTRYFAYLSFFCFSMLGIVVSDNLLMTFMFWELVGFNSYALIGFWFEKDSAAEAQKKAFVVNRVGDVGFLIGLMILYAHVGDFRFTSVFEAVANGAFDGEVFLFGVPLLTAAGIGLFLGAMGKSAQFPLHVWLPDAMEGPTTVSSLIHAATMVAAGVFLTARIFPILTPEALLFVAVIGAITAFLAATIALVQPDIKKVLAYSTVSQLGYMMLGLGSGGYTPGLAHLFTHAFFKCLLFLCAASVIHALHTQDLFRMGGLRRKMPLTFTFMFLGTLAISGVPLFSGFFSKDAILSQALFAYYTHPDLLRLILFLAGMLAAVMTAFYMFRMIFLTFFGEPRDRHAYDHAHESPATATVPLGILAVFTLGFFWTGTVDIPLPGHETRIPVGFVKKDWLADLITPPPLEEFATAAHEASEAAHAGGTGHGEEAEILHDKAHHLVTMLSMLAAAAGILLAYLTYQLRLISAEAVRRRLRGAAVFLDNLWYFDHIYEATFVRGLHKVNAIAFWFDSKIVDGLVNGTGYTGDLYSRFIGVFDNSVIDGAVNLTADSSLGIGRIFSLIQTGKIQAYIFIGVLSISLYALFIMMQ